MSSILERFKKSILENNDEDINIICHEVMDKNEELEDQGLSASELNHAIGSCMRTDFPNFDTVSMTHKSPYAHGV